MTRRAKRVDVVPVFAALADRTRLRLLNLMHGREVCVCYFVEILQQGQPKISRHLAYLRSAGLVEVRREGKWMHYRMAGVEARVAAVVETALRAVAQDPEMQADLSRLGRACCEPARFVGLAGAPVPAGVAG